MADNDNLNKNQEQDPFAHPIRRNNWWLYIFGGIIIAGVIIWFFIDWSYKNRHGEEKALEETEQVQNIQQTPVMDETLPAVTVDTVAP